MLIEKQHVLTNKPMQKRSAGAVCPFKQRAASFQIKTQNVLTQQTQAAALRRSRFKGCGGNRIPHRFGYFCVKSTAPQALGALNPCQLKLTKSYRPPRVMQSVNTMNLSPRVPCVPTCVPHNILNYISANSLVEISKTM